MASSSTVAHDALIRRVRAAARAVDLRVASDAFLASLVSGPRRGRTALAHLAYATNMPEHAFAPNRGEQSYMCSVCGASAKETIDRDEILEGLEDGDAIVADPAAAIVDLETFGKLPRATPSEQDIACFNAMLDVLARLPAAGRATDLVKKWKVPRSNAYGRAFLVETLGACGLLETPDHGGHLTRWVPFWEYDEVPSLTGDARPPEAWWQRSDGLERSALDRVFPQKGIDRRPFPKRAPRKRPIAKGSVTIPKKGKNAALDLRTGDLVGIEFEELWLAGVVLGIHKAGKKTLPVIEFYRDTFEQRPDARALAKAKARVVGPYLEAPHWRREPLALEGLELFGPVMPARLERLERDHAPPDAAGAPATHFRAVAPRNLLYLLSTLMAPVG